MDSMSDKEKEEFLNSILNEDDSSAAYPDTAAETNEKSETPPEDKAAEKTEDDAAEGENKTVTEEDTSEKTEDTSPDNPEEASSDNPEENIDIDDIKISLDDETEETPPEPEEYGEYYEEEHQPVKKRRKRRKKKKHSAGRLIFALVLVTVLVSISVFIAVFIIDTVKTVTGLDRRNIQIVVEIPENVNTTQIADILEENGIIDNADLFIIMAKIKGMDSSFSAGEHKLSPNMSYSDIMTELCRYYEEEREVVDVTFPEGITIYEAADILEENGVCDSERFIYIFNSSSFGFDFEKQVETSAKKFLKMEGFLFPDTYTFYKDEDAEVVAKKIYKNFENRLTPDYYGRMKDLGLTLEETITLASIVQAEGRTMSDMKRISAVFRNRLQSDEFPKLESDPTRKYVENTIKPHIEIPNNEMYKAYDTYQGEGLPPGAICNPGLDAISAVLYPADADYYFFCADLDTGEVFFAETLEEHEENLVKAHLKAAPVTTASTEENEETAAE